MTVWKGASRKLKKLRHLSPSDRRVLAEAMLWLPVTGAALRMLGFQRVHSVLTRLPPAAASSNSLADSAPREARAVARMVKTATHHGLYRATCLPESIVLWSLLRRRGFPVELHIGTRMDGNQFKAHAWVEIDGTAINDADDIRRRFAPFERDILPMRVKAP